MTKLFELFGEATSSDGVNWQEIVEAQHCPFLEKKCIKIRKSQSHIAIGTCTVRYGTPPIPIMICPFRLLKGRKIFLDCLHLLTGHEPGNDLHVVPEVSVPGGSIDYILASTRDGKVRDFVGIELQTLDTTGTVWPARQDFLMTNGVPAETDNSGKSFGMNWKMTAKTILVQLHHKISTFEHLNKHLVLVAQDVLIDYMTREFSFSHVSTSRVSDPMQFHSYSLASDGELQLASRLSTDTEGIERCLGLESDANVDLAVIVKAIENKIGDHTALTI